MQILYNTLMGVAAGLALILVPLLARKLLRNEAVSPEGWSLSFGILGVILTFLGGLMTVTWPLKVNPPINIMFAEPNLVLGLLLLAASLYLWKRSQTIKSMTDNESSRNDVKLTFAPVSWVLFSLGLILFFCTAAILRFGIVGAAPPHEPITGLLHDQPWIENTFFVILYGLSALGCLLTPFALQNLDGPLPKIVAICWIAAGVTFLIFSALNYYTHMGMLWNANNGTNFKF